MKLIKTSILPIVSIIALLYFGKYIYIVGGQIDWLRLCLVFGIPFGVPYMLFVIPIGGQPIESVTIIALNMIIGAIFGCVIAILALIRAVLYLVRWIVFPAAREL